MADDYSLDDSDRSQDTPEETTKLSRMRGKFQDAVDHDKDAQEEAHRCARFYHNTNGEGQWESADLSYLRDQMRPAFSFNIIKPKLDTMLGMYEDSRRTATVVASGGDDELLAEVLDAVAEQQLQDAGYERKRTHQMKTGTISGECAMHVEVEPSKQGRGWIKINLYRVMPFELHWDPSSIEPDRCDARYLFWDRWLAKDEFQESYPDAAEEWDTLRKSSMPSDETSAWDMGSEPGFDNDIFGSSDYDYATMGRYYYDRNKRKIRVIRYEYKEIVDKLYVIDTNTGERKQEIDEGDREKVEYAAQMLGEPIGVEVSREEVVKVCEFVASKILAEYDSAGPFEGFSISTYAFAIDEEVGTAYGFVRNLIDPQMELNKAQSLQIEHMAQRSATGAIGEEGSVTDETQFMDELRKPGGFAVVKKDALTSGRVILKKSEPADAGAAMRMEFATNLATEISGIPSSSVFTPAEQAQAGMTVAIRYNKSRQSVQGPFGNFEDCQRAIKRKVVESIVRAMPDDQIEAVLAESSKYRVGNGVVVEMTQSPEQPGQFVPKGRAELRDIRRLNWNVEMEHTSDSTTLRMLEFDALVQLAQVGVPIDPDVAVETAVTSRSKRERLKAFVEKTMASQAQAAQQESQSFQAQMQQAFQAEMANLAEEIRSNRADEALEAKKLDLDALMKGLTIWEKADEAEKRMLVERVKLLSQPRTAA